MTVKPIILYGTNFHRLLDTSFARCANSRPYFNAAFRYLPKMGVFSRVRYTTDWPCLRVAWMQSRFVEIAASLLIAGVSHIPNINTFSPVVCSSSSPYNKNIILYWLFSRYFYLGPKGTVPEWGRQIGVSEWSDSQMFPDVQSFSLYRQYNVTYVYFRRVLHSDSKSSIVLYCSLIRSFLTYQ